MKRAAVVPQEKITGLPDVAIEEALLLLMIEQAVQQSVTFGPVHTHNVVGHKPIEIKRLPASRRMRLHHEMRKGRHTVLHLRAANRSCVLVIVYVNGLATFDLAFQIVGQFIIRREHVGEDRVAALGRHFHRKKHRADAWMFDVALVRVKIHLPIRQRSDKLAIFTHVGDVHDAGQAGSALVHVQNFAKLPEPLRKFDLRAFIQQLAADEDDTITMPSVPNGLQYLDTEIITKVDAKNFSANARCQWPCLNDSYSRGLRRTGPLCGFHGHLPTNLCDESVRRRGCQGRALGRGPRKSLPLMLAQFTDSQNFYRHSLVREVFYTEGAQYVADAAGAHQLLDEIALPQRHIIPVKREDFQVWDLKVNADQTATLTYGDGNGLEVYSKPVPFTDFPEPGIRFYYADWVIHLPSEY